MNGALHLDLTTAHLVSTWPNCGISTVSSHLVTISISEEAVVSPPKRYIADSDFWSVRLPDSHPTGMLSGRFLRTGRRSYRHSWMPRLHLMANLGDYRGADVSDIQR